MHSHAWEVGTRAFTQSALRFSRTHVMPSNPVQLGSCLGLPHSARLRRLYLELPHADQLEPDAIPDQMNDGHAFRAINFKRHVLIQDLAVISRPGWLLDGLQLGSHTAVQSQPPAAHRSLRSQTAAC